VATATAGTAVSGRGSGTPVTVGAMASSAAAGHGGRVDAAAVPAATGASGRDSGTQATAGPTTISAAAAAPGGRAAAAPERFVPHVAVGMQLQQPALTRELRFVNYLVTPPGLPVQISGAMTAAWFVFNTNHSKLL